MSLENPYTFLLAKEKKAWKCTFNINSELLQNRTEKQIMPFKTTVNWLFNDTWCYLVMGCFDWKIWRFSTLSCKGFIVSIMEKLINTIIIAFISFHNWIFTDSFHSICFLSTATVSVIEAILCFVWKFATLSFKII